MLPCSTTLMLVSVIRGAAWPEVGMGFAYSLPPGWPVWTRRLIHRWTDDARLLRG